MRLEELQPTSNGYTLNVRGPGESYDVETGLNYNGQRCRDTATWRFLQSDPKGLAARVNTYAASSYTPLMQVHPNGLQSSAQACLYPQNAAVCAATGLVGRKNTPWMLHVLQRAAIGITAIATNARIGGILMRLIAHYGEALVPAMIRNAGIALAWRVHVTGLFCV